MNRRKAHPRHRSLVSFALGVVWMLILPQIATASVLVQNYMEGEIDAVTAGPQIYVYSQGSHHSFDTETEFDTGTYVDTEVDPSGQSLQLVAAPSATWWDTDWGHRRCFSINNPSATSLIEHPVRITFDSSSDFTAGLVQADGADYRAIAADNSTLLDLWVESGVGTATTTVWVQADLNPVSTTDLCLYFDNAAAATVSGQSNVFTYSTPRQLYYPNYWRFDGSNGANGTLDIVSYVDNNSVSVDGLAVTLNTGQTQAFTGVTEDSTILVTGPIAGRGRGGGIDSLVPSSFAGTEMIFPTSRSNQRWTIVAPSGQTANVEIYDGTTLQWSGSVGGTAQTIDADVTGTNSGIIRSTNGVPIIVTHAASNNSFSDALAVPPFFAGDDIYGVRSRASNIGFGGSGSVEILRSDGSQTVITGSPGSRSDGYTASDLDGNGTALRLTNITAPTGGLQQADRDGFESTSYLPERLLDNEYYLPSAAQYIAFACPTSMNVLVGGTSVPCGPLLPGYPGHGWHGSAPAGTQITSDTGMRFFAYYEDAANNDETNLLGMKSAQPFEPEPVVVSGGAVEQLPMGPLTGTWTSPVVDTTAGSSNVFGLLSTVANLPADTTVSFQVARGTTPTAALAAPFVGPDGTTATTFATGEVPAPFAWDFADQYLRVQITLSTTTSGVTPLVDFVTIEYDLPEASRLSSHTIATAGAATDLDYVLRIWTEDAVTLNATSNLQHQSSSFGFPTAAASWAIDGSTQIVASGATVTQSAGPPVPSGPALPQNVTVSTTDMGGTSMSIIWQLTQPGATILVPHLLQVSFV